MKAVAHKVFIMLKASFFCFLSAVLLLICTQPVIGDNSISSGTTLRVTAGTTLVSVGTLTIKSGANVNNQGTINLKANLDNQNPGTTDIGSGTYILNGTGAQTVNGTNIVGTLTINNAAGTTLNGNTTVTNALNLVLGVITIGANNLLLGNIATVGGSPSATAMVNATGSGEVRKSFTGTGSFTFPVGDKTSTPEYSPVTVTFTSGTFAGTNYAGVKVINSPHPTSSGSYLNRYWEISQLGITGFSCNMIFQYTQADVVGTESQIYCARVVPSPTVYYNAANTTLDQLTATSVAAFGTFSGQMIISADKTLNLSLLLEGLYSGGGMMQEVWGTEYGVPYFGAGVADLIDVSLRSTSSGAIIYSDNDVSLPTSGNVAVTIPGTYNGTYYIVISHRNSVQTWSASGVNFSGGTINYDFTDAATKAYGNNLKSMGGGHFAIYTGDVDQDTYVDASDLNAVFNQSMQGTYQGYLPTNVNGDDWVDSMDLNMVFNNSMMGIQAQIPF